MKKLSTKQLSILLIILVLLSEVFSYILLKGNRFMTTLQDNSNDTMIVLADTKDYKQIIKPTTFLWYQYQGTTGTYDEQDLNKVNNQLQSLAISNIQDVSDRINIEDIYNDNEVFEYQFPSPISHYILADIYNMTIKGVSEEIDIDTILIATNNTTSNIYFYNKLTSKLYQVSSNETSNLSDKLNMLTSTLTLVPYTTTYLGTHIFALPNNLQDIKATKVATQDFNLNSLKTQVFFKAHMINQQQNSDIIEYNNGAALIRIDNHNNTMSYINPSITKLTEATVDDLISNSLNFLIQHQGNTINYLYSGIIPDKSIIEYRYFYNNLPVFGNEKSISKITMVVGENQDMYSYNRSNFILDVVSGESNETYTLLSSEEVINYIQTQGLDTTQVYKIALGYELQHIDSNNAIYDLIPTWYYYYQNQWVKIDSQINTITSQD